MAETPETNKPADLSKQRGDLWCREGELNPQVEPFCGRERSVSPQAKS